MVFSKGKKASIEAIKDLFRRYFVYSRQFINHSKSIMYAGSMTPRRHNILASVMNFSVDHLPFIYLGAPIFKGRPKMTHFQDISDRIKSNLSSWKAQFLSITCRVFLVIIVIQSMPFHTLMIYSWPVALLIEIESWSRNFIWSGDTATRKIIIVIQSIQVGGLGLRYLMVLK